MKFIVLLIMITACSNLGTETSIPNDDSTSSNRDMHETSVGAR